MVASNDRSALCGNWRDNAGKWRQSCRGGSRLFGRQLGRLGPQRRASRRCQSLLRAVLAAMALVLSGSLLLTPSLMANVPDAKEQAKQIGSYGFALAQYESGQIEAALASAKTAGLNGDSAAQYLAGHILSQSGRDDKDAVRWLSRAANNGHDDAMISLTQMALAGRGGLLIEQAAIWAEKAAKLGRTDAMRALGDIYIKGIGMAPNSAEGIGWIALAADQGDVLAARRMGDLTLETKPREALAYYERAAELGDPESAYFAAIIYAENVAVKPNELRAAALMKQAALANHPAAMADYGLLIFQGLAGDGRAETAANWFEKAAKAGDDQGKFLYAYTLSIGDGVPQDFEGAYYWVLKANKSGIPEYDKDLQTLKTALEGKLDSAARGRVRARVASE